MNATPIWTEADERRHRAIVHELRMKGWDHLRAIEEADRLTSKEKAALLHPDKPGGSAAAMAELNAARDRALKEKAA